MRTTAGLFLAAILSGACGGGAATPAEDVVAAAQESLEKRNAGRVVFALEASAEGSETVGFAIEGDYDFGDDELAVMDVAYVVDGGENTSETRVVSDGSTAVLVADGQVVEVPARQARALRVGKETSPGLPELDLVSWIKEPEVRLLADRSEIRGELRAAAFVSDLQRVAAGVAGGGAGGMSATDADRLESSVKASDIVIEVDSEDHELRSLRATVEFGARVPDELRKALGRYAGARLSLRFEVDDLKTPLEVQLPD